MGRASQPIPLAYPLIPISPKMGRPWPVIIRANRATKQASRLMPGYLANLRYSSLDGRAGMARNPKQRKQAGQLPA